MYDNFDDSIAIRDYTKINEIKLNDIRLKIKEHTLTEQIKKKWNLMIRIFSLVLLCEFHFVKYVILICRLAQYLTSHLPLIFQ